MPSPFCGEAIFIGGLDFVYMKPYAREFYSSKAWQKCRDAYASYRGRLCEKCLEKGIFKPYRIVHHKVHITPENINDPAVTLNWENLECLCWECHEAEHFYGKKRYKVDKMGRVTLRPDSPHS